MEKLQDDNLLSENITSKFELANKKLAQEFTKQLRSENEALKEELSVKIQAEVQNMSRGPKYEQRSKIRAEVQNLSEFCNKLNTETFKKCTQNH